MIGFSVDEEYIVVTVSIKLSIKDFLSRVTEIYQYAVHYSKHCIVEEQAKSIMHDREDD
tara:strand:+ start:1436 stop:1612 length:177 start_codon:yes stop_codon:yes gene_type:complete